jgi:hypothetical protein
MAGLPSRIKNKNRKPKASREFTNEYQFRFALLTKYFCPRFAQTDADQKKFRSGFICVICGEKLWRKQEPKAKSQKAKSQEPLARNDPNFNTI